MFSTKVRFLPPHTNARLFQLDARSLCAHSQHSANKAMSLTPDALLRVFKSIDLDDSGTIELSELEAFCAPCLLGDGASSSKQLRITELFSQVDTDGSGEISFDEFCEARGSPTPVSSRITPLSPHLVRTAVR